MKMQGDRKGLPYIFVEPDVEGRPLRSPCFPRKDGDPIEGKRAL